MNTKTWLTAAALLCAGTAHAACFTVYKANGTLLFETSTSPVNLALPIGDTVTEKFGPGASMTVSDTDFFCHERRGEGQAVPVGQKSLAGALRAEEAKAAVMVIKGKPEDVAQAQKGVAQ